VVTLLTLEGGEENLSKKTRDEPVDTLRGDRFVIISEGGKSSEEEKRSNRVFRGKISGRTGLPRGGLLNTLKKYRPEGKAKTSKQQQRAVERDSDLAVLKKTGG